jgi:diadenosine tetraphosphate (Ap4A) HIT family hydrolase
MATYEATTKEGACIFCKIVAGEIRANIIWESDEFMAFLSIDPNTEGFSCVIPKEHHDSDVLKMPDDILQRYIVAAKSVAALLEKHFDDVGRVGLLIEGTGINHAHIKLAPLHGTENLKRGEWQQFLSGKQFWFPKYEGWISSGSGPMADPEVLKKLGEAIRKSA